MTIANPSMLSLPSPSLKGGRHAVARAGEAPTEGNSMTILKTFSVWNKAGFLGYLEARDLEQAVEAARDQYGLEYENGGYLYVYPDCGELRETA